MDHKDPNKREALWDKFCTENKIDKTNCNGWFQSQMTMYDEITHMKLVQGAAHYTDMQKWLKANAGFSTLTLCAIIP